MKRTTYIVIGSIIVIGLLIWGFQTLRLLQGGPTDTNEPNTTSTETENNSALSYHLTFGTTPVVLTRTDGGDIAETFWNTTQKTVSVNGDVTTLYNGEDWARYLYYDTPKQAYYELEPGGNEKLSLVTQQYIQKRMAETKVETDDLSQSKSETKCSGKTITLNNLTGVWSVACTQITSDIATKDILDTNTITECYVPVTNTSNYLAYEIPALPAGSDINLCDTIKGMKINSVSTK